MALGQELKVAGILDIPSDFEGSVQCASLRVAEGLAFKGFAVVDGTAVIEGRFDGMLYCTELVAGQASRVRGTIFVRRTDLHVKADVLCTLGSRPETADVASPPSHLDVERMISGTVPSQVYVVPDAVESDVPSAPSAVFVPPLVDDVPHFEVRSLHERLVEKGLVAPEEALAESEADARTSSAPHATATGRMALPSLV